MLRDSMRFFASGISLGLILLSSSACSSPEHDETTKGDLGVLEFAYQGGTGPCEGSCTTEREVLAGGLASLLVTGTDASVRTTARLIDSAIGAVRAYEECHCIHAPDESQKMPVVDPKEACSEGEKKCTLRVDVFAMIAGDTTLEITDEAGNVIDRTPMHVRNAARIECAVNGGPSKDGDVYEMGVGTSAKLVPAVFGADGTRLYFAYTVGVSASSANVSIVSTDRRNAESRESMTVYPDHSIAITAPGEIGETSLTVAVPGASTVLPFRVRP